MHPTLEIKGAKSLKLIGKRIVLGITGSIAAVETLKLCRELIRHGADVHPVMSESAQRIVTAEALHFAAGREPVTRIDGRVQHVEFFSGNKRADLFVISPCTANTISKIACGIDDTPVTTCATTAIGAGVPMLVVPAMDISMWNHPVVKENTAKLKKLGITVIGPLLEEKKAKIVPYDRIVVEVIRLSGKKDFAGKRVLVIAGSTQEEIDDIRVLTNKSTGGTGIALVKTAYERGAIVDLWMGRCDMSQPDYIPITRYRSTQDLIALVKKMKKYDIIIMPAAVSDFTMKKQKGKIDSKNRQINLELVATPKVIGAIRNKTKSYLVGFKLEAGTTKESLISSACERLREYKLNLIIANDIKSVKDNKNIVHIIDSKRKVEEIVATKDVIAEQILDKIIMDVR